MRRFTNALQAKPQNLSFGSKLLFVAMLIFGYADVLSGASRYVFSAVGAPWANYIPAVLLCAASLAYMAIKSVRDGSAIFTTALVLCVVSVLYSIAVGRTAMTACFAFYTWTAFFAGLVMAENGLAQRAGKHVLIFWLLAVTGVLINTQVHFPWSGESYSILGVQVETARNWDSFGTDRLPGFSRASFAAANQILICLCILISVARSKVVKALVWLVSLIAIGLTTSKTPLIAALLVPLLVYILALVQKIDYRGGALQSFYFASSMVMLTASVIFLPLTITIIGIGDTYFDLPFVGLVRLDSLFDRVRSMWPDAFNLINSDLNHGLMFFFGRGVGGIGAGQTIDEMYRYNTADNMFVFLFVTFGVSSLVFFGIFLSGWWRKLGHDPIQARVYYALAVAVLILGTLTSVTESNFPAFAIGMIAAQALFSRKAVSLRAQNGPTLHPRRLTGVQWRGRS